MKVNWAVKILLTWCVVMIVLGFAGLLGQPMLNIFFLAFIITGIPAVCLFPFMQFYFD